MKPGPCMLYGGAPPGETRRAATARRSMRVLDEVRGGTA